MNGFRPMKIDITDAKSGESALLWGLYVKGKLRVGQAKDGRYVGPLVEKNLKRNNKRKAKR